MVKSYCVKEKIHTECAEPSGYKRVKSGRLMHFCTCASCSIIKTKFVSQKPGLGVLSSIANATLEGLISKETPYLAKRAQKQHDIMQVQPWETLNYKKKRVDYALDKLNPVLHDFGSEALNQLSTRI